MIDPVVHHLELLELKEFPADARESLTELLSYFLESGGVVTWEWWISLEPDTKACLIDAKRKLESAPIEELIASSREAAEDDRVKQLCLDKALEMVS